MAVHVIVIAHPDDESMFFLPTIQALAETRNMGSTLGGTDKVPDRDSDRNDSDNDNDDSVNKHDDDEIWLLCLTTGDYDGLGKVRTEELINACNLIGVTKLVLYDGDDDERDNAGVNIERTQSKAPAVRVYSKKIHDHPKERWDPKQVSNIIRRMLLGEIGRTYNTFENRRSQERLDKQQQQQHQTFNLITFDARGVSGHVNHIDTYLGVCQLLREERQNLILCNTSALPSLSTRTSDATMQRNQQSRRFTIRSAFKLQTEINILFKYIPLWSWIILLFGTLLSFLTTKITTRVTTTTSSISGDEKNPAVIRHRLNDPFLNWTAMATHRSQFVWYRRLFVIFSCYTYYNILTAIESVDGEKGDSVATSNIATTINRKQKDL